MPDTFAVWLIGNVTGFLLDARGVVTFYDFSVYKNHLQNMFDLGVRCCLR